MLKVKRLEGKVDQIKIMESKLFHYACVCIHASLTFVYHDNRDLSLCCSASEYAEIGYTKSGLSFALKTYFLMCMYVYIFIQMIVFV